MCTQRVVYYTIVVLLLKITYSYVLTEQNHLIPAQWALEGMPFLSIIFATSEYLPAGPCKEDTRRFLHDLLKGSLWATQMFDSSTKYPDGIFYGHTRHLGNFDECYNIQVNITEEGTDVHEINGKYCLIDIIYKKKQTTSVQQKSSETQYMNNSLDITNSFWKVLEQLEGHPYRIRRNRLQLALCVPATCSAENIETALKISLKGLGTSKNIELQTSVQPNSCHTVKEGPKFTLGAGVYCVVLVALLSLVIISTWYDRTPSGDGNNMSVIRNIMLHFSARRNYEKIFNVNYTHTGLDSIYFIRFFIISLTVYMHNVMQYMFIPIINVVDIEEIYKIPLITLIVNATVTINIMFALSGVLHAFQLLKDLDQNKQLKFVKNVALRYMRLTPLYATIIGFYIWILPLLGSGPFWNHVVEECAHCAKNWWINLLYIHNYVAVSEFCVTHGWYLAADFQLFVCSQFVIYAFWYMPRNIGYPFLGILTLISCTVSFVATYVYNASSILRFTPYVTKLADLPEFKAYYIKTHMSATGYLVGIIAGAILHDHKGSSWRLSKFWSNILVCPMPVVLYVAIQYWAHKFFILSKPNLLEEAIFAFFQRLIPALCTCSIIVLSSIGTQSKFYHRFFTSRWIQPLANLTYGVYIVHFIFLTSDMEQTKTAKTFSVFKSILETIPVLLLSYIISLLLAICIEMPFRSLTKWLFLKNNTPNINGRILGNKVIKME
ncbi:nose resistant to fluoxetine protein 6-like isoform X2 [Harpegnathos saltator]|uniref:nose resistant to fluoxetine protein 6-like isoform X2 n=1 Tax=Harpegnathos saltator TaxID=610380 RepID=UPI000DBEDA98|nr:nose resistant to fluoxetine protein 6-like isoform X2 [Harpegnathos saltator]